MQSHHRGENRRPHRFPADGVSQGEFRTEKVRISAIIAFLEENLQVLPGRLPGCFFVIMRIPGELNG
jgi:hypothetical protein